MARQLREQSRRSYSSPTRQAQAAATRRAIVHAARDVFAKSGYGNATIEAIADAAKVSLPTVYAVFGSKPGVLSAVVADGGSDPDIRALAESALGETRPRERLESAAKVVRKIMQRESSLLRLLEEAGTGTPELKAASHQLHEQQRRALERVLLPLYERQALRRELGLDEAVATFGALASPQCYSLLVGELGWSAARWERWLGDSAARLFLGPKS
jgi:AcrR family transcriptional regulator